MRVPVRNRVLKFIAATITTVVFGLLLVLVFSTPSFSIEFEDWIVIENYPLKVRWNEAVVHNGHIFVIGGKLADESPTNAVKSTKINPDGSLESWQDRSPLLGIRYLHAVAADETHLYVSGGWNSSNDDGGPKAHADIQRAQFEDNGGLGGWKELKRGLPKPIRIHQSLIVNGYLYIIGGFDNSEKTLDTVYFAKIEEGELGEWQQAPPLPHPLRGHSAVVYDNFLYVTGGFDSDNIAQSAIYMARFESNGDLSSWQKVATLRQPTNYHRALIHNDRLIIIGGTNRPEPAPEFKDVYSASIDANGALGDWDDEPELLQELSRFGAVVANQAGHEYIYTIGGETKDDVVSSTVSHSVPLPPPTPTPGLMLNLTSDPTGWIAPNEEITYTIEYNNPGVAAITEIELHSWIPENTELVADSITKGGSDNQSSTGFQPGDQITWTFDEIGPDERNSVSYRVLRPLQPTSSSALVEISKSGPATVDPGDPITYTLTITSTVVQDINNLVIKDRLPRRATYVSGGALGDDGYVRWEIPILSAFDTITVEFVVTATQSLINSDYLVDFDDFSDAIGRDIVITRVGDTPLPPEGDGTVITNQGASASWSYGGNEGSATSRVISNPSFSIYMPTVSR